MFYMFMPLLNSEITINNTNIKSYGIVYNFLVLY